MKASDLVASIKALEDRVEVLEAAQAGGFVTRADLGDWAPPAKCVKCGDNPRKAPKTLTCVSCAKKRTAAIREQKNNPAAMTPWRFGHCVFCKQPKSKTASMACSLCKPKWEMWKAQN